MGQKEKEQESGVHRIVPSTTRQATQLSGSMTHGASSPSQDDPTICKCGAPIVAGASFCVWCSVSLLGESEIPVPAPANDTGAATAAASSPSEVLKPVFVRARSADADQGLSNVIVSPDLFTAETYAAPWKPRHDTKHEIREDLEHRLWPHVPALRMVLIVTVILIALALLAFALGVLSGRVFNQFESTPTISP